MQTGLRLYQAIIDKSQSLGIEFEAAASACGFSEEDLVRCFDETPLPPLDLYAILSRERIQDVSRFLKCSGFRIFLLADVFRWEDYRLISTVMGTESPRSSMGTSAAAEYLRAVAGGDIFDVPDFIVENFIASNWARSLDEACRKAGVSYRKLLAWKNRVRTPELVDLADIRVMAKSMEMGTPLVMSGLGLLQRADFEFDGIKVSLDEELDAATDVEIW